jgi:hypothetical protein
MNFVRVVMDSVFIDSHRSAAMFGRFRLQVPGCSQQYVLVLPAVTTLERMDTAVQRSGFVAFLPIQRLGGLCRVLRPAPRSLPTGQRGAQIRTDPQSTGFPSTAAQAPTLRWPLLFPSFRRPLADFSMKMSTFLHFGSSFGDKFSAFYTESTTFSSLLTLQS